MDKMKEGEGGTAIAEFALKIPKDITRRLNRSFAPRRKMNQPMGWIRGWKLIHSKEERGTAKIKGIRILDIK